MTLTQDVDVLIAEEGLSDANLSHVDETPEQPETPETPETPEEQPEEQPEAPETPEEQPETPETAEEEQPEAPAVPESNERSPTETVEEGRSLIQNLNLTDDKVFNEDGSVKPWTEVVPAGAYLASQLDPVTVTDKDGKVHEFLLLSDVEKAFPDGFEAKNNIEQMKFERAILNNETKFDSAVKTYKEAEAQYNQETASIAQQQQDTNRLRDEYTAMANAGIVPKVGDPKDPKFNDSEAVKELNNILSFMDTKNTELAKQGIPPIQSLWVAKQLMSTEQGKAQKEDKKQQIINERKEVASLTSSPTPDTPDKKAPAMDIPMSRFADQIIADEGLR